MAGGGDDPLILKLTRAYYDEGIRLFQFYVDLLFPAVATEGKRLPILTEELTNEEEEWSQLEEIEHRWRLWQQGGVAEDSDILRFDKNEQGAQDRLAELRLKYSDGADGDVND